MNRTLIGNLVNAFVRYLIRSLIVGKKLIPSPNLLVGEITVSFLNHSEESPDECQRMLLKRIP